MHVYVASGERTSRSSSSSSACYIVWRMRCIALVRSPPTYLHTYYIHKHTHTQTHAHITHITLRRLLHARSPRARPPQLRNHRSASIRPRNICATWPQLARRGLYTLPFIECIRSLDARMICCVFCAFTSYTTYAHSMCGHRRCWWSPRASSKCSEQFAEHWMVRKRLNMF